MRTLVIGTLMTVVLLVTAIPRWGAVGAASVALAMSLALPALRLGFLARQLSVGGILRQGQRYLPAVTMVLVMLASEHRRARPARSSSTGPGGLSGDGECSR